VGQKITNYKKTTKNQTMTNPKSKRKATAFIEEPAEEESEVAGSDYESDQVSGHVKQED
jgi:hypothetical protein